MGRSQRDLAGEAWLRSCLQNSLVMISSLVLLPELPWNIVSILWTTENNFCIVYASNNSHLNSGRTIWLVETKSCCWYAIGILLCLNFHGKSWEIASHKENSQWQTQTKIGIGFGYSVARMKTKMNKCSLPLSLLKLEEKKTKCTYYMKMWGWGGNNYRCRERQMPAVIVLKPLEMASSCWIYCGFWL